MVASAMEKGARRIVPEGKRRPTAPCGRVSATPAAHPAQRLSAARRRAVRVLVAGLATLPAACSSPKGDIALNPHPTQRYELIATVDAPGPFDAVEGYLSYDVTNVECVPKHPFEGARNVPNTSRSFELIRVDAHTWKGSFYRDLLQDEDYFGLGPCHWDVGTVSPVFVVHGQSFNPGLMLPQLLSGMPYIRHFKVRDFFNRSKNNTNAGSALSWSARDDEVRSHPERFFAISASIRRVTP